MQIIQRVWTRNKTKKHDRQNIDHFSHQIQQQKKPQSQPKPPQPHQKL